MSDSRLPLQTRSEERVTNTEINVFDSDIESQQVELIYRQAPAVIGIAMIIAALVTAGLWSVAGHKSLLLWLGAQAVLTVLRLALVAVYRRAPAEKRQHSRWMLLFFVGNFFAGIVWGCIGLLFSFDWPVQYQTLALVSLAGVLAGAISSYAVNLSVYIAFMVPAILIPAQSMLIYSGQLQNNLGLMLVLLAAALLIVARNYNQHALQVLHLRQANDNLISEMSRTNANLAEEITERSAIEQALRVDQQLFTNGPVVVFRWSADSGWPIEYVSSTVDQFGYQADELVDQKKCFSELIHPGDLQRVQDAEMLTGREGLQSLSIDYRILGADGAVRWVFDYTIPVYSDSGELTHYFGYLLDITERKDSEFELEQRKELAQVTLHSIADAVITTDVNGQIEYMNPSAEAMTEWDHTVARGLPVAKVFSAFYENNHPFTADPVGQCLAKSEATQSEDDYVIRRHGGGELSVRYSVSPILSSPGKALGAVLVFHDVTRARNLERTISYQATHDALTGLWNRTEFELQLEYAITETEQSFESHVVCIVDIDQLKVINETCAHESGDRLLVKIADLLTGALRDSDVIARLGGDEFGLLMKNCSLDSATQQVDKILADIQALRFTSCGRIFAVSSSIGIAQITPGCKNATQIMSEADLACHTAKENGGNRIHTYQSTDVELVRRQSEMQWVSRISDAIKSDRLVLYCQQIVPLSAQDDAGLHIEVLVRMLGEDGAIITPDRFLPAAERYQLIADLDNWVISHSLGWYAEYAAAGESAAADTLSINLSGVSVGDPRVLEHIKCEISRYAVPPGVLCFEITETAAISNLSAATGFIRELRRLGCRFALDDFGSGLSSFAYLKNLPVDFLKIDGAFVSDMHTDEVNFAMVSAIQQLGKVIGTRTIAEYVCNEEILHMLGELGVDYAQGFAIAKPVALADLAHGTQRSA
jgi:diguanylate cyclase (GGDEF)-like protein/PAS domain S-box-containing protein